MPPLVSVFNDKITSISIQFLNAGGGNVAAPAGDTLSAVSSAPGSLSATIGGTATAPLLVLTPLVRAGTGYTVTVSDSLGVTPAAITVDITPDPAVPAQLQLIYTLPTTVPQPIPSAPGP